MSKLFKLNSYIASMAPFFCYLIIMLSFPFNGFGLEQRYYKLQFVILIAIALITFCSVIYVWITTNKIMKNKNNSDVDIIVKNVKKTNDLNYALIVQNVLPVISIVFNLTYATAIFSLLIVILLGFIWIRNDLHYQNIIFELKGLKVYSAEIISCKKGTMPLEVKDGQFADGYLIAERGEPIDKIDANSNADVKQINAFRAANTIFYVSNISKY